MGITVHADPLMPFTDAREAMANVTITVGDPDRGTKVVPVSTTSLGAEAAPARRVLHPRA